jgi:hypothetical protein
MTDAMPHHAFYLWDLKRDDAPKLAIVSRQQMVAHVPDDKGCGTWKEIEIPFDEFAGQFLPIRF